MMRGLTRRVCSPALAKAAASRAAFERPPQSGGIGASLLTSAPADTILSTSAPVLTTIARSPSDAWECMTSRAFSSLASPWAGCAGSLCWPRVQERCAIGVPSIFRVSFVSFSSDSRRWKGSLREAIRVNKRVNKRIMASTSVQELLSVIATSHRDFDAVNVATSWRMLAKVMHARTARGGERLTHGGSKDIATVVELLSRETTRVKDAMNPQDVANSLWAFGKLAERGVDVDAGAVRAVSGGAVRVAGIMIPQNVANSLWAFGKLAERGMDVDAGAVRAVSGGAVRVAGIMNPQDVANSLWAFGKLAERGVDVDAGAVRAVSGGAVRVAGDMNSIDLSNMLVGLSQLVMNGFTLTSVLERSAWLALVSRAKTIQHEMTHAQREMSHRAVSEIIKRTSEEQSHQTTQSATHETKHPEVTSEVASADFWAAGERWLSKLPEGKRAKLKNALSTAETDAAKVQLLVASAEDDTTKVRAEEKRTLLEAAARGENSDI